jgi:Plasmid pRiA4b ORF-3-like protein
MTPTRSQPGPNTALRLRIQLNEVDPVVWRRLLVPGKVRLAKLGQMLLAAMGWNNSHLHAFRVGDTSYGMQDDDDDDFPDDEIDEQSVTVLQALRELQTFTFDYDFGDGWEHEVVIEELIHSGTGLKFAVCLDGERACPPDDVGGPGGYVVFLEAIADDDHEEHHDFLEWVGGSFDPAEFDVANANALLQKLR